MSGRRSASTSSSVEDTKPARKSKKAEERKSSGSTKKGSTSRKTKEESDSDNDASSSDDDIPQSLQRHRIETSKKKVQFSDQLTTIDADNPIEDLADRIGMRKIAQLYLDAYPPEKIIVDSYNRALDEINFIIGHTTIEVVGKWSVRFSDVKMLRPVKNDQPFFPSEALKLKEAYTLRIRAMMHYNNEETGAETSREITIANIPLMVGSKYCNTIDDDGNKLSDQILMEKNECPSMPGGYFVISGMRSLIGQERLAMNTSIVFVRPKKEKKRKIDTTECQMYCRTKDKKISHIVFWVHVVEKSSDVLIKVRVPSLFYSEKYEDAHEITLIQLFRLFIISDVIIETGKSFTPEDLHNINDIVEEQVWQYVNEVTFNNPTEAQKMMDFLDSTIRSAETEDTYDMYLRFAEQMKLYIQDNIFATAKNMKKHLTTVLFPQITSNTYQMEADPYSLVELAKKRMLFYLTMRLMIYHKDKDPSEYDNRDHFGIKRIELAGTMISSCFSKAMQTAVSKIRDTTETNIPKYVEDFFNDNKAGKKLSITQQFYTSFVGENWCGTKTKNASFIISNEIPVVSIVISSIRRITSMGDKARKKIEPHLFHQSQENVMCPYETMESERCGIVKHEAISMDVSRNLSSEKIVYESTRILNRYNAERDERNEQPLPFFTSFEEVMGGYSAEARDSFDVVIKETADIIDEDEDYSNLIQEDSTILERISVGLEMFLRHEKPKNIRKIINYSKLPASITRVFKQLENIERSEDFSAVGQIIRLLSDLTDERNKNKRKSKNKGITADEEKLRKKEAKRAVKKAGDEFPSYIGKLVKSTYPTYSEDLESYQHTLNYFVLKHLLRAAYVEYEASILTRSLFEEREKEAKYRAKARKQLDPLKAAVYRLKANSYGEERYVSYFVNGTLIGYVPVIMEDLMRQWKRSATGLDDDLGATEGEEGDTVTGENSGLATLSIYRLVRRNREELHINSSPDRVVRPVFIVKDGSMLIDETARDYALALDDLEKWLIKKVKDIDIVKRIMYRIRNGDSISNITIQLNLDSISPDIGKGIGKRIARDNLWGGVDKYGNPITWNDLVFKYKVIEYIDVREEEHSLVAPSVAEFRRWNESKKMVTTHVNIDPSFLAGYAAAATPNFTTQLGTRTAYAAKHTNRATGIPPTYLNPSATMLVQEKVLIKPQRPLVSTAAMNSLNLNKLSNGLMARVAILSEGYNVEDAVIVNKASLDRGLGHTLNFHTVTVTGNAGDRYGIPTKTKVNKRERERDRLPISLGTTVYRTAPSDIPEGSEEANKDKHRKDKDKNKDAALKNPVNYPVVTTGGYSHLEGTGEKGEVEGIVKVGTVVQEGDILISKITPNGESELTKVYDKMVPGRVSHVVTGTTPKGDSIARVKIYSPHVPMKGDKLSSRFSQKGLAGTLYEQVDMPFGEISGLVPDIIINPHGFPGRQTYSQIYEMLSGKAIAAPVRAVADSYGYNSKYKIKDCIDFWIRPSYYSVWQASDTDYWNQEHDKMWEQRRKASVEIPTITNSKGVIIKRIRFSLIEQLKPRIAKQFRREFDEKQILFVDVITPIDNTDIGKDRYKTLQIAREKREDIVERMREGTTFTDVIKPKEIEEYLLRLGWDRYGDEPMIDGRTGERLEATVFVAPAFYHIMTHMAVDKFSVSGGSGMYSSLTRQRKRGKKEGSTKNDEMSFVVMLGHSSASYAIERLGERAGRARKELCGQCGTTCTGDRKCRQCGVELTKDNKIQMQYPYSLERIAVLMAGSGMQLSMSAGEHLPTMTGIEQKEPGLDVLDQQFEDEDIGDDYE